jgi:Tol biopolymer transport system component
MRQERWCRAEELFHAALEQAPGARTAFLDTACAADTELRQQIELLLSRDEHAGRFLEEPVFADVAGTLHRPGSLVGRQFGPYRILALLGAGGMGEVYRAHDAELDRDVAIKTLPVGFARNPAALRREARMLASLNHSHIATVYGLEQSAEMDCLVLELVEGEVLRGPLPIEIALERADQVAEALEAAHAKGIIHRDLKPANVKITPQGRVKVLDFGLAKAILATDGTPSLAHMASIGVESTAGHIAGTPGYMSPEQSLGEQVDQRTDIWAFGCLLFELLAGKRAFPGETRSESIAAVLEREPDWPALPAKTPAKIRELLRNCMQKDANRRLANIGEARTTIVEAQRGWRHSKVLAAAALVLLAVGLALWLRRVPGPPDRSEWIQLTKFPDPVSQPALSPDGRMLAFVRGPRTTYGSGQVYVKPLPDGEPVQLTHDELRKADPAFSPDGARIAYTAVDPQFHWDIWAVPVNGGEPRFWLRNAAGITWAGPQQLLFGQRRINSSKGLVTAGDANTIGRDIYFPRNDRGMAERSKVSPDKRWVLVAEMSAYGNWDQCRVVPMDGSSRGRQVGPPGAPCEFAAWSPDGKWMYLTSKAGGLFHIWRQRFPDGKPEQFTSGITEEEGIAMVPDGRSLVTAVAMESSTLWIHDGSGERQISVLEGNAADPKFAPDGERLYYRIVKAVQIFGTKKDPGELWTSDLRSGLSERMAPGLQPLEYDLSRDGTHVVMDVADREGKPHIWVAPVNHTWPPRQIPNIEGQNPTFGPDGEIFFRRLEGSASFVYCVRPDASGLRKAVEQPVYYSGPVSPDGRWVNVWAPLPKSTLLATQLLPLDGGPSITVGSNTVFLWPSNGDSVWIAGGAVPDGQTYIVPLPSGMTLPRIPEGGFHSEQEIAALPGARRLESSGTPGPSSDIYAFERHTIQRNLYRIPIP